MSRAKKPPFDPYAGDPRVREIATSTDQEFRAVCDRQKAGEFLIREIVVGATPGAYTFKLRYAKPYTRQMDLI